MAMHLRVRHRCLVLLAGGLLLAQAGCADRCPTPEPVPAPIPAPTPVVPTITATPATLPLTTAPATQAAVEPSTLPAIALEPVLLPATQPATAPAATTEPTTAPAPAPVAANTPALATAPAAIPLPETRPVETPPTPITTAQAAIDAGLRRMLDGLAAFTPDLVANLAPADQQFVKVTLQGLEAFHARLATNRPAATAALVDMTARLRPAEGLQIPTLTLCSRVDDFGVYNPIAPEQLPAFRESGVVLYCEVQGFSSRRQELNWETRLLQQVTLVDAQGQAVWRDEPNTVVDLCRRVRRDFFIARIIRLPVNLPEGKYTLQVSIEDQLSGQKTQSDLPLQLGTR